MPWKKSAAQFSVGLESANSILEPHLENWMKGRFKRGQLYIPVDVTQVNAMVHDAAKREKAEGIVYRENKALA